MAHKKAGGSSRNGRDSESKRIGIKVYGGELNNAGSILVGGRGGSIYAVADVKLNTLIDYRYTRIFRAQAGENGRGADCYGKGGDDIVLRFPVGTVIRDAGTGDVLADLARDGERATIARGG